MVDVIVKIKDRYFMWSTVVDAPIWEGLLKDDFISFYKQNKNHQECSLDERMKRVDKNGTSAMWTDKEGLLSGNRAGPKETHLTEDEIYNTMSWNGEEE